MRTYESLLLQSNFEEFEWILIDDNSNDNERTRNMIRNLAESAPFTVKYKFLNENHFGSKSTFTACEMAVGEYACILDHDDELTPGALDIVKSLLKEYKNHTEIAGVCGRCIDEQGNFIGKPFRTSRQITTEGDMRFRKRITGELFQFTRVSLMTHWFKKMKPGYTNGFVWANISKKYKYVYVNDILRVYDTSVSTSASNSEQYISIYPTGSAESLYSMMEVYNNIFLYNPVYSIKLMTAYLRYKLDAKENILHNLPKRSIQFYIIYMASLLPAYLKHKRLI